MRVQSGARYTLGCRQAVRHQTLTLACVGSNPAIPAIFDPLAQLAEQLPFKQWVRGSNPRRVTKNTDALMGVGVFARCGFGKSNATVWRNVSHMSQIAARYYMLHLHFNKK